VEEGGYKENLRYFADPMLFLKKAIRDAKIIDFESVNFHLIKNGKQEIDFSDLTENFSPTELEQAYAYLRDRISDAISRLEEFKKIITLIFLVWRSTMTLDRTVSTILLTTI